MIFTEPRMQALYDDWETMAPSNVALLRMQVGDNPNDPASLPLNRTGSDGDSGYWISTRG